jgi:hypothetical protein
LDNNLNTDVGASAVQDDRLDGGQVVPDDEQRRAEVVVAGQKAQPNAGAHPRPEQHGQGESVRNS